MNERLIVALDVEEIERVEELVGALVDYVKIFKIGSFLFTAYGPRVIDLVIKKGGRVFLDLKYFDIPSVVANSVRMAQEHGVFSLTLSILGGRKMLEAASEVQPRPFLWGVTILTSLNSNDIKEMGISREINEQVSAMAGIAREAGLDGVVVSPLEIDLVKRVAGEDFVIVTPGIRVPGLMSFADDQKRSLSPSEAVKRGADYLVVGRPIVKAPDPVAAVKRVLESMQEAK